MAAKINAQLGSQGETGTGSGRLLWKAARMSPKQSSASVIPLSQWHRPVTYGDLEKMKQSLKEELLEELKRLLIEQSPKLSKKCLSNEAVRVLLVVSAGTLQSMRGNGILPFSRIGRHFYYDPIEIDVMIERRKGLGRREFFTLLGKIDQGIARTSIEIFQESLIIELQSLVLAGATVEIEI